MHIGIDGGIFIVDVLQIILCQLSGGYLFALEQITACFNA